MCRKKFRLKNLKFWHKKFFMVQKEFFRHENEIFSFIRNFQTASFGQKMNLWGLKEISFPKWNGTQKFIFEPKNSWFWVEKILSDWFHFRAKIFFQPEIRLWNFEFNWIFWLENELLHQKNLPLVEVRECRGLCPIISRVRRGIGCLREWARRFLKSKNSNFPFFLLNLNFFSQILTTLYCQNDIVFKM